MENGEPESGQSRSGGLCRLRRMQVSHRHLLFFFPELYRLYDRELEGREKATSQELRQLVDLCSFCGQCPCPNIRTGIIEAKTLFIERDGLKFGVRMIEDVERVATVCGAFPRLTNAIFQANSMGTLLKAAMGIHKSRSMLPFPTETFSEWAKEESVDRERRQEPEAQGSVLCRLHRQVSFSPGAQGGG